MVLKGCHRIIEPPKYIDLYNEVRFCECAQAAHWGEQVRRSVWGESLTAGGCNHRPRASFDHRELMEEEVGESFSHEAPGRSIGKLQSCAKLQLQGDGGVLVRLLASLINSHHYYFC